MNCVRVLIERSPFAALALAGLLTSVAWADQVVMKNGDRVTGNIIKQDGKSITIKTVNFGVVAAPWDQVSSAESEQPVTVVLKDGKIVAGKLSGGDGRLAITVEGAKVDVSPAEVTAIRNADEQKAYERLLKPALSELWTGNATLGWAGTAGNAKTTTFTTTATASRVTNTDKISLDFAAIKASALVNGTSASTAQAVRGGVAYDHNVTTRLFAHVFNDYEYDRFQDLDLRFVIGGGLGFHAVKTDRAMLDLVGGVDYNHSTFTTLTRTSAEAFWGDDYSLKLSNASSLTQSFRMFNNLSDTGNFRVNFDVSMVSKLRRWLSWNVALGDRYLSNPVAGRKTNDWLYSTGLGLNFGK